MNSSKIIRYRGLLQRILFFGLFISLSVISTLLFADWLARTGLTGAKWTLLVLFAILTTGLSFGFCQSFIGFLIMISGRDRLKVTDRLDLEDRPMPKRIESKIALLFPVYNEDTSRFYNGIASVYKDLEASGFLKHFTFFILSDSTDPNRWIEEEKKWLEYSHELKAKGRIFYRHRISNINQKSGNVSDFCRRWGSDFDHMICFDADSLMSAQSIVKLTKLMEVNPKLGIIQTMPGLFGAQTLFARLQQFANRIHGEMSGAGLNYWQQSEGNYWGHNAIIRLKPFVESCALPELPGPKPLGGRVLSHDFVEAALMRKAGYEVWLAYDIGDSFEELPPTLIDFVMRDRRWCQGNLQHAWIALFGRIPFINRVHMLNGIYAYAAAPMWLLFLLISTLAAYSWKSSELSLIITSPTLPFIPHEIEAHGFLILLLTFGMILLPKTFTIIRILTQPGFRRRFGGAQHAIISIFIEVFVFSLIAPVFMLFHSAFVVSILTGNKVKWTSQNRSNSAHTSWSQAVSAHCGQTIIGIAWGVLAWKVDPSLFYWMSPLLIGWLISIPLSVISSHTAGASWLYERGYLNTPEDIQAPNIIFRLYALEASSKPEPEIIESLREDFGLIQVALDPYYNALHLEFLPPRKNQNERTSRELQLLANKLLTEGAAQINTRDKARILNDPYTVRDLHKSIWTMPESELHTWWRLAVSRYSRQSITVAHERYEEAYLQS